MNPNLINEQKEVDQDYKKSMYRLRKSIGVLGLALPVLLLYFHDTLLASMSHYYYSSSSVFFITILTAFGLILFGYKGYPPTPDKKEFMSDDLATTLAAIFIFITVLVPTDSENAMGSLEFYGTPIDSYLFGHHDNDIKNTIHLVSAGLFLSLLGYMSYAKFTLSDSISDFRRKFFKWSGIVIWACIGLLLLIIVFESLLDIDFNTILPAYTFWLEMVAVWSFAIAWLIKGRLDEHLMGLIAIKKKE